MKKKLALLGSLFVIFFVVIGVRYIFFKDDARSGKLRIVSSPIATVFVDEKKVGKTPFESDFKTGEYLIRLEPHNSTSSSSWKGKVSVYHNSLTYLGRDLSSTDLTSSGVIFALKKMSETSSTQNTGEIEIMVEPKGATVYLDGEEKGFAPLLLTNVPRGQHELSAHAPGSFKQSHKITVDTGYRVIADYKLAIDPTYKEIDVNEIKKATQSADLEEAKEENGQEEITITETGTGWLRVRSEPSLSGSESARVNPGDTFKLLDKQSGWYKIEYAEGEFGWISSNYAAVLE